MPRRFGRLAVLGVLVLGSACTHLQSESGARADRNTITKDQLTKNHYSTVYDAVESLRANWLQTRGTDGFSVAEPGQSLSRQHDVRRRRVAAKYRDDNTISFIRYFDGVSRDGALGVGPWRRRDLRLFTPCDRDRSVAQKR